MYFWESNFQNAFFKIAIFKMYFLREQFWKWIFEEAILAEFKEE